MKYQELVILLPCHGLEDFPIHHEGQQANGLLACWTAMWHPALLAACQKMPTWARVDDPPEDLAQRLIIIPEVSQDELQTGFVQRAKDEGAIVVRRKHDRDEILAAALKPLDSFDPDNNSLDPELVADFLALGYCYLQVQLLTRQMRYSSNLDEIHFQNQLLAAASAIVEGDAELAEKKLAACFDLLAEERDHYYPVDVFLIDLTMVAPTTLGKSLRDELQKSTPINLLLPASTLRVMASEQPETLAQLKTAVADKRVGIVGGEFREQRNPLHAMEGLLANLRSGLAVYKEVLETDVTVYGRRRFGLTPALPQVLNKLGFEGVLHATLEDGQFPNGTQAKIRWEGDDGSSLDALSRAPQSATTPETFLGLAVKMGESMDMDHVATVCLAHWPGQTSIWYEDLRRAAKYGAAMGKFITFEEFFRDTDLPGHLERFDGDQYRSPYLKQAVIRRNVDPLSSSVRYWKRRLAADASQNLTFLRDMITGKTEGVDHSFLDELEAEAESKPAVAETESSSEEAASDESHDLTERIEADVKKSVLQVGNVLPRGNGDLTDGCLVLNPSSYIRRMTVDSSDLPSPPKAEKPVYASEDGQTIVDVPAMGFAWIPAGDTAARSGSPLVLAEEGFIRNEFFECTINMGTGSLQSVHEYKSRGNRLSQRLAFREPGDDQAQPGEVWNDPDSTATYSEMVAKSVEVTQANSVLGEIVTQGELLGRGGKVLASFVQTFRLWRGSRVLNVDIQLTPTLEPKSDAWNSYYACRFAWADQAADLWRGVNQSRQLARSKKIESPLYLEIENGNSTTTILTGGLPYHRRTGIASIDSLLVVRGETARQFQFGIGVDVKNSLHEAMNLLSPSTSTFQTGVAAPKNSSSWLFHIDARNVIATAWEPTFDGNRLTGYRVRLLETAGRIGRGKLNSFRSAAAAKQLDFQGEKLSDCEITDGAVQFEMAANQWIELEVQTET
ncbi:MAG: alpha-mannosidase [Pirellulaceae bacterium]|jgi:alpha-mannosidase